MANSAKDSKRLMQLEEQGKTNNDHLFMVNNLLLEDKEPELVPGGAIARFVVNSDYQVDYVGPNQKPSRKKGPAEIETESIIAAANAEAERIIAEAQAKAETLAKPKGRQAKEQIETAPPADPENTGETA